MPAELTVALDTRSLAKLRLLASASRVSAAKALTFTAERAQEAWIVGQGIFHHRNTWIDRGVRMRAATAGNLNAQVGTLDRYMGRHITGIDDPKEGRLFIPIYQRIADARKHNVERRALSRMQDTKRKPFILRTSAGTFLARRMGKGRTPLQLLGKFQEGAKDGGPKLDALAIVDGVVQREFPTIYERVLLKWASTA